MSFEHVVESAAVFLTVLGAALLVLWALLRHWARLGVLILLLALLALTGGAGLGAWAWHETRPRDIRGSPTIEFSPKARPQGSTSREEPWPTYGRDLQRTHVAPFRHRPPFRQIWRFDVPGSIEYPPAVAYGRVYFNSRRGRFYALDAASGRAVWEKRMQHCSPASPMIAHGVVYQSYVTALPCADAPDARGFVVAWDADTGRELWRHDSAPVESSPLLVGKLLYFGSWDGTFYSLEARTGKVRWTYDTGAGISGSPAYDSGTVFAGSDDGHVFALDALTGTLRWRAASFARFGRREYFYATPTLAYGRLYIGNTDGTLYAFGAESGRLLWASRAGTYIYSAAAAWRRRIFVGTWDGYFSAFDAATGELLWRHEAAGGISGAPTVMAGLVYYSTFGRFTHSHQRPVKNGPYRTYALDARTGKPVWQFPDGQYSPVVADADRVYLVGSETVFGLVSRDTHR